MVVFAAIGSNNRRTIDMEKKPLIKQEKSSMFHVNEEPATSLPPQPSTPEQKTLQGLSPEVALRILSFLDGKGINRLNILLTTKNVNLSMI